MASIIKVDQIQHSDGTTPSIQDLGLDVSGSILQVQSDVLTSRATFSGGAWYDTGISVTMTPKSTNSKFIICPSVTGSVSYFTWGIRLLRDGSVITESLASNTGSRIAATMSHNDYNAGSSDTTLSNQYQLHTLAGCFHNMSSASNTNTSITFKIQGYFYLNGAINSSLEDGNTSSRHRCTSSLVVYEVEK